MFQVSGFGQSQCYPVVPAGCYSARPVGSWHSRQLNERMVFGAQLTPSSSPGYGAPPPDSYGPPPPDSYGPPPPDNYGPPPPDSYGAAPGGSRGYGPPPSAGPHGYSPYNMQQVGAALPGGPGERYQLAAWE